jgi:hypothetical protein
MSSIRVKEGCLKFWKLLALAESLAMFEIFQRLDLEYKPYVVGKEWLYKGNEPSKRKRK